MPLGPLVSKEDLLAALWERSDYSVEEVRDQLRATAELMNRASAELGFLMHQRQVDPDHIPNLEVMLPELDERLNQEEEPLRWLKGVPLMGQLLGFPKRRRRD